MALLHPSIKPELFDYLESAGFTFQRSTRWTGSFTRDRIVIMISHLKAEISHVVGDPAVPGKIEQFFNRAVLKTFAFEGLGDIDLVGWAELLDLTGAVPLKELVSKLTDEELRPIADALNQKLGILADRQAPTLALYSGEEAGRK